MIDKEKLFLPSSPGVYLFKQNNRVLYVGKSVNIKARVYSHIDNAIEDSKERAIIRLSNIVDYIVCDSEFKALLLESVLIKKFNPKYNVIWKDGKSHLYIKLTIRDKFPKILLSRKENDHRSLYIGPFSSTKVAESIIKELRKIIPFCTQKNLSSRACFYSKIGLCNPCPNVIHREQNIRKKKKLTEIYNSNIRAVRRILTGYSETYLQTLYSQLKKFSKSRSYESAIIIRNRIFSLEKLLFLKRLGGPDISLHNNIDSEMQSLLKFLSQYFPNLTILHRIECYDVSTTGQKLSTASMVVLKDGVINTDEYKRFKIKNKSIRSDFDMLKEVLTRRFAHSWQRPDLVVVDGGKPQVKTAVKVFSSLKIKIPLIGIAKHPDRVVLGISPYRTFSRAFMKNGILPVERIRDESHRFAKKYHVFLRSKAFLI